MITCGNVLGNCLLFFSIFLWHCSRGSHEIALNHLYLHFSFQPLLYCPLPMGNTWSPKPFMILWTKLHPTRDSVSRQRPTCLWHAPPPRAAPRHGERRQQHAPKTRVLAFTSCPLVFPTLPSLICLAVLFLLPLRLLPSFSFYMQVHLICYYLPNINLYSSIYSLLLFFLIT